MSLARTLLTAGSLARSQYFERGDLERLQAARLRRLLAHAAATVPYYRDLFARSGVVPGDIRHPSDLARVPISTRHGLQAAGLEAYTSRAFAPSQLEEACTTGSSGRRFTVRYDPGFNAVRRATFLHATDTQRLLVHSQFGPEPLVCLPAPANTFGLRRIMFAVDDIDDVLTRLKAHGAELVGEVARYEDLYRLCYVRGPEGIIIALAEQLR
jgi:catechol 2,3-dioxygenase-like lactoylglutathione lyase family enzyme